MLRDHKSCQLFKAANEIIDYGLHLPTFVTYAIHVTAYLVIVTDSITVIPSKLLPLATCAHVSSLVLSMQILLCT